MLIFSEITEKECVKERYPPPESKNLTNNACKWSKTGHHLVLFTNRQHFAHRLWIGTEVASLNYLEQHNGHYFLLFYCIWQVRGPLTSMWLKLDYTVCNKNVAQE